MGKLKILYLCGYYPLPVNTGNRHRIYHIAKLLQELGDVTLGVISLYKRKDYDPEAIKREFGEFISMNAVRQPERGVFRKLRLLWDKKWVEGRDYLISAENQLSVKNTARQHDVVWIHTLEVADRIGLYQWPQGVLDLDDLNHVKFALSAKLSNSIGYKAAEYWRSALWKRWEKDVLNRFDVVTVCSEEDKLLLGQSERVHVVPNGFDTPENKPDLKMRREPILGFIGTLEYYANLEGLSWFVDRVFPLVLSKMPSTRLRVVGHPPKSRKNLEHENIDLLGFVEDYGPEIDTWAAMIVPIRIGGGTRIKILDAFSRLCPVVSTTLGAHGLHVESGRQLILRDTPAGFAEVCVELMSEPEAARPLVERGWQTVSTNYNWNKHIKERVKDAVFHCVDSGKRAKMPGAQFLP